MTRVHWMCFAIFRTCDVRRRCTSWWRAGSQSFMKLFFLLLWQLYWLKFTRVLWNYIYLNWNKALFRYFWIFNDNFPPSEIGNIALTKNCAMLIGCDSKKYAFLNLWSAPTCYSLENGKKIASKKRYISGFLFQINQHFYKLECEKISLYGLFSNYLGTFRN
jgi:hypothetical protein